MRITAARALPLITRGNSPGPRSARGENSRLSSAGLLSAAAAAATPPTSNDDDRCCSQQPALSSRARRTFPRWRSSNRAAAPAIYRRRDGVLSPIFLPSSPLGRG